MIVATYNTHAAVGADRRCDPSRIVSVVKELDADIVGLQEVDSRPAPGSEWDQFEYYANEYGFDAVPGPNLISGRGTYGNLFLSRLPVRSFAYHDLSITPFEPRGAIDARVQAGHKLLRVLVTHLGLRWRERRRQLARLEEILRDDDGPLLVLGDFNVFLTAELRATGFGVPKNGARAPRSYWSRLPLLALDRIWARPHAMLEMVWAHRSALSRLASDHLPVVGRLTLDADARRGES